MIMSPDPRRKLGVVPQFLAPCLRSAEPLDMYSFQTMVKDLPAELGLPLELTMRKNVRLADVGSEVRRQAESTQKMLFPHTEDNR